MGSLSSRVTKESLERLHAECTDREVAALYGVTDVAVSRLRYRWGITTLSQRERREVLRGAEGLSLDTLTPAKLVDLYTQMGDSQIGALYGVSGTTIRKLRQDWGILSLSKRERSTSVGDFTEDQKQICMGTLLGDGHLMKHGVLKISHAWHQLSYTRWLQRALQPHARPLFYEEKQMDTGTLCFAFGFRTQEHVWLRTLRGIFYPEGRRIFPQSVLEELGPLGLAVWYFDDGNLASGLPSFALGEISDQEAEAVCQKVHQRFGLDTYVRPQSTETCKIMGVRGGSADIFFHLVRSYATPDMLHKLPQKHWTTHAPLHIHSTPEKGIPQELGERCCAWDSLSAQSRETLLGDLVAYWHQRGFPHYVPRPEELETLLSLSAEQVLRKDGLSCRPHNVGQATCQAFATHIWEARSWGSKQSPREIFEDADALGKAMCARLTARSKTQKGRVAPMSAAEVRVSIRSWKLSGVYNFRPSLAKILVDLYGTPGGTVYDPCAGYGGRMLGVVLSQHVMRYVGCDPHREGIARLGSFAGWLEEYLPGVSSRVSLHVTPAEDFYPPPCDLVITSPPYWCREQYEDSPQQSGVRYPTYAAWLEGFWSRVLGASYQALRPGGWMLLNVDDFTIGQTSYPLVKDTLDLCRDLGLHLEKTFRYEMPRFAQRRNHESILALVKHGDAREVTPAAKMTLSRCTQCGCVLPARELREKRCSDCRKPKTHIVVCEGCGQKLEAHRGNRRFCSENCRARHHRKKKSEGRGAIVRSFLCISCGKTWETEAQGSFKWCPVCREREAIQKRTQTCAYHHCGREFVDTTPKNSMSYCHPEHRRREKLFRSGKAKDLSYFRSPDPVLG